MLKVLKFGGSSMASAAQYAKVKAIVEADPSRRAVVVSAAGKRSKEDHKVTLSKRLFKIVSRARPCALRIGHINLPGAARPFRL